MKINREDLLKVLESVRPGLTQAKSGLNQGIEQGDHFCFTGSEILTFNGELACRTASPLRKVVQGAVPAEPLLDVLRKRPEEELEIECDGSRLDIVGSKGSRRSWLNMEAEVSLP